MKLSDESYRIHALCLGDSGTGKTGSLISLINAGYHIKLLDLENGSRILYNLAIEQCPDKLENVDVEKISTKYKIGPAGAVAEKAPSGLINVGKLIDRWQKEVGPDDIVVVDSLTALGRLCLVWSEAQNRAIRDRRQHYFNAQEVIEPIIATLTHEDFPCHTLILTHIDYRDLSPDPKNPTIKGYASSVGRALGDKIPTHFNEVFMYQTVGAGASAKRIISSVSNGVVDVKNTVPSRIQKRYDINTGLAEIFTLLKGN